MNTPPATFSTPSVGTRHAVSLRTVVHAVSVGGASVGTRHAVSVPTVVHAVSVGGASVGTRHAVSVRKSIRLKRWDYSSPGWYFVTVCVVAMEPVFGTVVNGRMVLNAAGRVADRFWREIPAHFPRAVVDEFVVMPNHVHGLLCLLDRDAPHRKPLQFEAFGKPVAESVSTIMRSYKGAVTRELGRRVWQGRFYDVRARTETARANIRRYIRQNPGNYAVVRNGAKPRYLGNRAILDMPKVGYLASRGAAGDTGRLALRTGEAVISGFLSPAERGVFQACLDRKHPAIWVKPWGLDVGGPRGRGAWGAAVDEGCLLVVSPFPSTVRGPNARRAVWCNEYVLAHADRVVVGHLHPDGMLACVLSEAGPDLEIVYPGGA